jgi:hypothetical protein
MYKGVTQVHDAGKSLRRIARDLDSPALFLRLAAPSSRNMRRLAVDAVSSAILSQESDVAVAAAKWPLSEVGDALQKRQVLRLSAVVSVLLRSHAQRLVTGGWKVRVVFFLCSCLRTSSHAHRLVTGGWRGCVLFVAVSFFF